MESAATIKKSEIFISKWEELVKTVGIQNGHIKEQANDDGSVTLSVNYVRPVDSRTNPASLVVKEEYKDRGIEAALEVVERLQNVGLVEKNSTEVQSFSSVKESLNNREISHKHTAGGSITIGDNSEIKADERGNISLAVKFDISKDNSVAKIKESLQQAINIKEDGIMSDNDRKIKGTAELPEELIKQIHAAHDPKNVPTTKVNDVSDHEPQIDNRARSAGLGA